MTNGVNLPTFGKTNLIGEYLMEIWCDSADAKGISHLTQQGWIHGVTTNPKILSTQAMLASSQIAQLLAVQTGPLAVQVSATCDKGMLAQAQKLHALSARIVVKIPMTPMGIKVLPQLKEHGIPTLATAVFGAEQFLLAAKMGVDYVAPYLSHMSQQGINTDDELTMMQQMIHHYRFSTKVMAASIQDVTEVKKIASLGVAAITLTPQCLEALMQHPLTEKGTHALLEAWHPFAREYAGTLFA